MKLKLILLTILLMTSVNVIAQERTDKSGNIQAVTCRMKYRQYRHYYRAKDYVKDFDDKYSPVGLGVASFIIPGLGQGIADKWGAATYIGKVFAKSDRYRMIVSSVLLSMPYCGLLIRKYYQTRFCQLGYLLTSSGIPMLKSLAMIETVIGFCPYERSIKRICSEIERGRSFSESLGRYEHLYGRNFVTLLKVGEETNRLDCMLRSQAEAISAELDYEILQLNNVVEPMMILTIGIIVAFILIAMYLPMFRLGMLIM